MDKYIGRLLDNRYEILEVIGTGGMAVVYKARCHRLNRLVAIKILKDEYSQDEEFRRRFHAEGQAVAMLSHPNIVQVYDVSSSDNADFIVMELIDGITLKQYMEKKGILNWKETLHFAIQIGKALEHAHSRGIVHRDIKPHNVMVLKNGSVKVTDFGIARVMSKSNTLTKEALGSVHYISPEQAKGGRVDNRSDLYSLGVVMYEMMAGRPPYDGESPVAVAIQHINGGAPLPSSLNPNIPAGLEQIIMKAMAVDPNERYSSATAMLYDMDEFRKEPTMLFDYHGAASMDDATMIHRIPLVPEEAQPETRTTAERVAGSAGAEAARRRPDGQRRGDAQRQSPEQQRRRRQQESGKQESSGNRAATVAIVACSAVAVIAIIIFLVTLFNGGVLNRKQELLEVPQLLGEYYDQEALAAKYSQFEIVLWNSDYSTQYQKDQIMEQNPKSGEKVEDNKIYVTLSLGERPAAKIMENLVGMNADGAKAFLEDLGMKVLPREDYSPEVKEGLVIRTDPAEGAELTDGQTVTIWVSLGEEITKAKMPNLVGQQLETALTLLTARGFDNVLPQTVESAKPEGEVVSQSIPKNEEVDVTTQIVLEVSKGPAQTSEPTSEPTESTEPPPVEKRVVLTWDAEMTEPFILSLQQGDVKVVDDIRLEAGTKQIEVILTGTGIQKYRLCIYGLNSYDEPVSDEYIYVDFTE